MAALNRPGAQTIGNKKLVKLADQLSSFKNNPIARLPIIQEIGEIIEGKQSTEADKRVAMEILKSLIKESTDTEAEIAIQFLSAHPEGRQALVELHQQAHDVLRRTREGYGEVLQSTSQSPSERSPDSQLARLETANKIRRLTGNAIVRHPTTRSNLKALSEQSETAQLIAEMQKTIDTWGSAILTEMVELVAEKKNAELSLALAKRVDREMPPSANNQESVELFAQIIRQEGQPKKVVLFAVACLLKRMNEEWMNVLLYALNEPTKQMVVEAFSRRNRIEGRPDNREYSAGAHCARNRLLTQGILSAAEDSDPTSASKPSAKIKQKRTRKVPLASGIDESKLSEGVKYVLNNTSSSPRQAIQKLKNLRDQRELSSYQLISELLLIIREGRKRHFSTQVRLVALEELSQFCETDSSVIWAMVDFFSNPREELRVRVKALILIAQQESGLKALRGNQNSLSIVQELMIKTVEAKDELAALLAKIRGR